MRDFWTGSHDTAPNRKFGFGPHDERVLLNAALVVAFAIFWASFAPHGLFPALLGALLFFAALATSVVALLRRERLFDSPVLTGWDQAALYLAVSIAAGWFVDPATLEAALQAATDAAPGPAE